MVFLSLIILINQIFYFFTAKIVYDKFIWNQMQIGLDEKVQSKLILILILMK